MTATPAPAPDGEAVPDTVTIDELIASFGGDLRAVIDALVVANAVLEEELELARAAVSSGFSRGWHHRADRPGARA